jgi:hypothetical protein
VNTRVVRRLLVPLAAAALLAGCKKGAADRGAAPATADKQATADLKQLGLMYHSYCDVNKKGPSGVEDVAAFGRNEPGLTGVVSALRAGKYVLVWNVNINDPACLPGGISDTVLGYEASVPNGGGAVLMALGSVQPMTAAEFQAAPKALGK